ncbi:MAG: helix-turn-helix domain-containing protein [Candidatus Bipolaricaulaceae bacterium]
MPPKGIGEKLRALRRNKGLTLEELSAGCGLSVSFLSQVERGVSSPSIVSLSSICRVLEIPVAQVLTEHAQPASVVTKADDQLRIQIADSAVAYRYLSGNFPGRVVEVLINEFPAGHRHPLASHDGEEFGYVLEGHLILRLEDERFPLDPGDSYHFLATRPHGYETTDGAGAQVLVVTTQKFIEAHWERQRMARG